MAGINRKPKLVEIPFFEACVSSFPEQILARKEQETIEGHVVRQMCKGWTSKLVFTGIRFRSGLILMDCATEDTAEWIRTIVPKLPGWEGAELSTYAEDDIPKSRDNRNGRPYGPSNRSE